MNTTLILVTIGVGLIQIVSGAVLIWAVFKIRKFLKSSGEVVQQVNIRTLVLHSSTFVLFAFSIALNTIFYVIAALYEF